MNDISTLLREAKPLYFKRKRQRRQLKSFAAAMLCVCAVSVFSYRFGPEDSYYNIEEELYLTENGGFVEDMGLPTDDFGLLKVG